MAELSPAAQAVRSAYHEICEDYIETWLNFNHNRGLAAVLRAAADQVVPEENVDEAEYHCLQAKWAAEGEQDARMRFLAIADELEAQP